MSETEGRLLLAPLPDDAFGVERGGLGRLAALLAAGGLDNSLRLALD